MKPRAHHCLPADGESELEEAADLTAVGGRASLDPKNHLGSATWIGPNTHPAFHQPNASVIRLVLGLHRIRHANLCHRRPLSVSTAEEAATLVGKTATSEGQAGQPDRTGEGPCVNASSERLDFSDSDCKNSKLEILRLVLDRFLSRPLNSFFSGLAALSK